MERKEAIRILKGDTLFNSREKREALEMAISSLETDEAYQLEYEKPEFCADCISRAEVLKLMKDNWHTHDGDWAMQESMDDIRALPSVYPKSDAIPRERIEQMVAEIEQIHRDWFKEYDSATAYTKISEFIHKYTKEQNNEHNTV